LLESLHRRLLEFVWRRLESLNIERKREQNEKEHTYTRGDTPFVNKDSREDGITFSLQRPTQNYKLRLKVSAQKRREKGDYQTKKATVSANTCTK
jgi:hypothetical protein